MIGGFNIFSFTDILIDCLKAEGNTDIEAGASMINYFRKNRHLLKKSKRNLQDIQDYIALSIYNRGNND